MPTPVRIPGDAIDAYINLGAICIPGRDPKSSAKQTRVTLHPQPQVIPYPAKRPVKELQSVTSWFHAGGKLRSRPLAK